MAVTYQLIRSSRKTVSVEIQEDGTVLVRAPERMAKREIDRFVLAHQDWIEAHIAATEERRREAEAAGHLSMEEIRALADQAMEVIPARVRHYAPIVGVTYGRITIRNQKTRWGSCSAKGNLNFNCLLMLMPAEILDYVVVHELAHRIEMNHSPAFWRIVEGVLPDYKKRRKWLKENGGKYIAMMSE